MGFFSGLANDFKSATSDVGNFFGVGDISNILGVNNPLPNAGAPIGMFGLPSNISTPMMEFAGLAGGAELGAGAMGFGAGGASAGGGAGAFAAPDLGAGTLYGGGADTTMAGLGGAGGSSAGGFSLGGVGKGLIGASGILGLLQSNQMMQLAKQSQGLQQGYAGQLQNLMQNPQQVMNQPGYQFGFDQGNVALQRMLAAGGYTGSGNALVEAQKYGQEYAGTYLQNQEANLARLSGAYGSASTPMNAMQGSSDMASRALATLGFGAYTMGA